MPTTTVSTISNSPWIRSHRRITTAYPNLRSLRIRHNLVGSSAAMIHHQLSPSTTHPHPCFLGRLSRPALGIPYRRFLVGSRGAPRDGMATRFSLAARNCLFTVHFTLSDRRSVSIGEGGVVVLALFPYIFGGAPRSFAVHSRACLSFYLPSVAGLQWRFSPGSRRCGTGGKGMVCIQKSRGGDRKRPRSACTQSVHMEVLALDHDGLGNGMKAWFILPLGLASLGACLLLLLLWCSCTWSGTCSYQRFFFVVGNRH